MRHSPRSESRWRVLLPFHLTGVLLGLAQAATQSAWVDKYGFFPIVWTIAIAILVLLARVFLAGPLPPRSMRHVVFGYLGGTIVLFAAGFGATGDRMRFVAFRAGLIEERQIHPRAAPSDWRMFAWGLRGLPWEAADFYLIHDPLDRLDRPTDDLGFACPLIPIDRFWPHWRLVGTLECALTNDALSQPRAAPVGAGPWTVAAAIALTAAVLSRRRFGRVARTGTIGFASVLLVLTIVGIDRLGRQVAFLSFRAGLIDLDRLNVGPHEWRVYHLGAEGFIPWAIDTYLVHDPRDRLDGDLEALGLACPIAVADRPWPHWRVIITDNCVLEQRIRRSFVPTPRPALP